MDEEEPEEDGEEMEQVVEEPKIINGNGVTKNNSEQAESQEVKLPHRRFFRKKPA